MDAGFLGEDGGDALLDERDHFLFEPRVAFAPEEVARAGVNERDDGALVVEPVEATLGEVEGLLLGQVKMLGVGADEERELHIGEKVAELVVPERGAFRPGWIVAGVFAFGAFARIAEAHGHEADVGAVEDIFRGAEPCAEAVSGDIVKWAVSGMGVSAGGLAGDEDAVGGREAHDGARTEGQVGGAEGAGADGGEEGVEGVGWHFLAFPRFELRFTGSAVHR